MICVSNKVVMALALSVGSVLHMCAMNDVPPIKLVAGPHTELIRPQNSEFELAIIGCAPNDYQQGALVLKALSGLDTDDDRTIDFRGLEMAFYKNNLLLHQSPWSDYLAPLCVSSSGNTLSMSNVRATDIELSVSVPLQNEETVRIKSHLDLEKHPDLARNYIALARTIFAAEPTFDLSAVEAGMKSVVTVAAQQKPVVRPTYLKLRVNKKTPEHTSLVLPAAVNLHQPQQLGIVKTRNVHYVKEQHHRLKHLLIDDTSWEKIRTVLPKKYVHDEDDTRCRLSAVCWVKGGQGVRWKDLPEKIFDITHGAACRWWNRLYTDLGSAAGNNLELFLKESCYSAIQNRNLQPGDAAPAGRLVADHVADALPVINVRVPSKKSPRPFDVAQFKKEQELLKAQQNELLKKPKRNTQNTKHSNHPVYYAQGTYALWKHLAINKQSFDDITEKFAIAQTLDNRRIISAACLKQETKESWSLVIKKFHMTLAQAKSQWSRLTVDERYGGGPELKEFVLAQGYYRKNMGA
jgi:hypothetical protein